MQIWMLLLLWISHFIVDFMIGVWNVFKTMAGIDLALAGVIAALCALIGEGAQVVFGSLSDKGYRKQMIALGVALTSANAFLAFTDSTLWIVLFLLLTCLGSGAFHPSSSALLGSLTVRQKGLYFSFFSTGGALGMAFSQITYAKVHGFYEGNTLPLLLPIVAFLLILFFFGFNKKEDLKSEGVEKKPFNLAFLKEYFSKAPERRLFILQVCNQMIFWGAVFFLPDVLVTRGYEEDVAYGGGNLAFVLGAALLMIPTGYLADRISVRTVMLGCTAIGMVSFVFVFSSPELSEFWLLAALAFTGAMVGIIQPLAIGYGNELGKKNPGMAGAFSMGLVWCVSETIGPMGLGFISKLFVEDAPARALLLYSIFFPVVLYAAYRLPVLAKVEIEAPNEVELPA